MTFLSIHRQRNDDRRAVGLGSLTRGHHIPADGRQACQTGCILQRPFGLTSSLLTGRGFAPRPFSIQTAGGRCIGYRRRRVSLSLPCWPVANSCSAISGSSTLLNLRQHVSCQGANAAEGHQVTLVYAVGFNANRHSERQIEPCSPIRGKRFPR